ncbi:CPBP family intramembrane glutamic endopeptidase [Mycetocola spongiae]|uniref:CPBP family intramembrane glutamic endopeptidase n=1 Tax=Mycetocola spongiae TaxID=2859226 RepID=UPI001CF3562C|nr:CPBP family intramembrane glutamic endopeptidase [Mycetocola spongiae]
MNRALRVRPRVWIGLAIWLGYIAVILAVGRITNIPYPELGSSGETLFRGAGISLIVGTILLAATTTALGWWRPALLERRRSAARWPIIAPALMAVLAVLNLMGTDWAALDAAFIGALLVLLLVGFTEELTTRGLLLVALRSRLGEVWVWAFSTLAFALMHLINAFSGQDVLPTLSQVGFAFLGGTLFYILRRITGTLLWAMLLHGLWDVATFAASHGTPSPLVGVVATLYLVAGILGLIAVPFVIRGAREGNPTR